VKRYHEDFDLLATSPVFPTQSK